MLKEIIYSYKIDFRNLYRNRLNEYVGYKGENREMVLLAFKTNLEEVIKLEHKIPDKHIYKINKIILTGIENLIDKNIATNVVKK